MFDFDWSLNTGKIGEHITERYLEKCGNIDYIDDVRDNAFYRFTDVDYIAHIKTGFLFIEVKTDTQLQHTGNIVYETSTSGNIGCFKILGREFSVFQCRDESPSPSSLKILP